MLYSLVSLFGLLVACPSEPAAPVEPTVETPVEPVADPSTTDAAAVDGTATDPTAADGTAVVDPTAVDGTAANPTAVDGTAADPTAVDPTTADPAVPADAAAGTTGTGTVGEASTGATVKLSGTYKFTGSTTGKLRIDIFTMAEDGKQLKLAQAITLTAPGPWEADVKRGLGLVRVNGFVDTGKPPGDSAPTMSIDRVMVGNNSIKGLDLELVAGGKVKEFGQ